MTMTYHDEHLLDRAAMLALRGLIALQPESGLGPEARPGFDALMEKTPAAHGVTYEAAEVGVVGWWCRPGDAVAGAAILYLHGGAYVVGSAAAYRNFAGQIAARAKAATFVAGYALAPERPFPIAFDDAKAAYRAVAAAGFTRIAIAGDSAGGGLALAVLAAVATEARLGTLPAPSAAAVMSPWIDLALTGDSMDAKASADPLLTRTSLAAAAHLYLGEHDPRDPRVSALHGDFTDLPPVLLHVGEDEVLLDDARRYAAAAEAAGISAELHVWQGMVHVFPANLALLRAAPEALDSLADFLRRHSAA
jgi:monoterpene epsilon-lactone hydrolase